jgi:predicted LPLAT superfamily acyltransferase
MQSHWAQIGESGMLIGMRFLYGIHHYFGRWPFRLLLWPVMLYYFLGHGIARRASLEYLQHIEPQLRGWKLFHKSFRHFLAFGECIMDKALAWNGQLPLDSLRIEGLPALKTSLASGQGAVLLVSHFGNMEVSRALARLEPDIRLTVLVHTKHAQRFNHFLAALNPESQADLIQVTEVDAAIAILLAERIARGELVVIAADRVPVSPVSPVPRVVVAPFLGSPAPFPVGPFVLAGLLKCPVFLLFCPKFPDGYRLIFEPFAEVLSLPRATREAALQAAAARFAERLAYYCRQAPLQWFNFFAFWAQPVASAILKTEQRSE